MSNKVAFDVQKFHAGDIQGGSILMKHIKIFQNKIFKFICLASCLLFVLSISNSAFAADSISIINEGTGLGGDFDSALKTIGTSLVFLARAVSFIMTVTAIVMVMFHMEQGSRILWNWVLGIGLAVNFGAFLSDIGFLEFISAAEEASANIQPLHVRLSDAQGGGFNILGEIMNYYRVGIIEPGAKVILPICLKILIILSVIQAGYDISFKLVSGDKIKYMLSVVLKLGLMIFILQNWINGIGLMHALNTGFEMIGYKIGGQGFADLQPDQIVGNAFKVLSLLLETSAKANAWSVVAGAFTGGVASILTPISFVVCVILLFLTAIEMFMARMEFYTMAVLVMPLLPFIMTSKLSFLSEKAISAMFNLAIKCCVIAFLFSAVVPFLNDISEQLSNFQLENFIKAPILSAQLLIICLLLYLLTKRCSALVTGLLNGTPAFSGSDMTGALVGGGTKAASAAGQVRAAKAAVVAAGTGGTGALVMALGKNLVNRNPITQGYRAGITKFGDVQTKTSQKRIDDYFPSKNNSKNSGGGDGGGDEERRRRREKAKEEAKKGF